MEFGKRCEIAECNKEDFLPFTCENCKKTFCSDHGKPEKHDCKDIPKK